MCVERKRERERDKKTYFYIAINLYQINITAILFFEPRYSFLQSANYKNTLAPTDFGHSGGSIVVKAKPNRMVRCNRPLGRAISATDSDN